MRTAVGRGKSQARRHFNVDGNKDLAAIAEVVAWPTAAVAAAAVAGVAYIVGRSNVTVDGSNGTITMKAVTGTFEQKFQDFEQRYNILTGSFENRQEARLQQYAAEMKAEFAQLERTVGGQVNDLATTV